MVFPFYDISKFIDRVEDKDRLEIIRLAVQEVNYLEPKLFRVKGAVERRKRGGCEYVAQLKEFIFFMRFEIKPTGVKDWIFRLYRPVCEKLVEKGQMKSTILDFFE